MAGQPLSSTAVNVSPVGHLIDALKYGFDTAFRTGWFGPGRPITPVAPEPEPRIRQMPVGTNIQYQPRGSETTSFAQLRFFAENYDVARIAINARKEQLSGFDWSIIPRRPGEGTAYTEQIKAATLFFQRPDKMNDWPVWLGMLLEDRLTIDALTMYPRKTKGGHLYALEIVDGSTIKPLVDIRGKSPDPPLPAYQQVLWGMPRSQYTRDQLLYLPQNVRTSSPYGFSEIEGILYVVNMALRKRIKDLAYFSSSNIPAGFLSAPDSWTLEQIREYNEYLTEWLSGNLKERSKLVVVPSGKGNTPIHEFTPFTGDPVFDIWLLRVTCAALHITPQEIGFTIDVNRSSADSQENIQYRTGIKPLSRYVETVINRVLTDLMGMPYLRFQWEYGETEDIVRRAQADQIYVQMGAIQIDEVRERMGFRPYGMPPIIPRMNDSNYVPINDIVEGRDFLSRGESLLPASNTAPPGDDPTEGGGQKPGPDKGPPQPGMVGQSKEDLPRADTRTVPNDSANTNFKVPKGAGFDVAADVRLVRVLSKANDQEYSVDIDIHGTATQAVHAPHMFAPIPGLKAAVRSFVDSGMVVYFSCGRLNDPVKGPALVMNVQAWLKDLGFGPELDSGQIRFNKKPHTIAVVDDKAIVFGGDWAPVAAEVLDRLKIFQDMQAAGGDPDAFVSANPKTRTYADVQGPDDLKDTDPPGHEPHMPVATLPEVPVNPTSVKGPRGTVIKELRRWKRVAVKAAPNGEVPRFQSEYIPTPLAFQIQKTLTDASESMSVEEYMAFVPAYMDGIRGVVREVPGDT